MRALAKRIRTGNDFRNFVGNRRLARAVVADFQLAQELSRIIRRSGHGGHTRPMLAGFCIGHAPD